MKAIPCLAICLLLLAGPAAWAQELVWAADAEGGAPYTFPDPRNPAKLIGFEVDLADALAARMGRVARFVQNQWDGLVPGLERSEYDVVINGIGIRKSDDELLHQVNAALESLKQDGTLKKIYRDWGIYNAATAQAFGDRDPVTNDNAVRYIDYLDAIRTKRSFRQQLAQYWNY